MENRISITPSELNNAATYLGQRRDDINSAVIQLENMINDVISRWEGAAQLAYQEKFTSLLPMLKDDLPSVVTGLQEMMTASANAMNETDQYLANAFKG